MLLVYRNGIIICMKVKKSPVGKQINYGGLTAQVDRTTLRQFIEHVDQGKSLNILRAVMKIAGVAFMLWGSIGMVAGAVSSGASGAVGGGMLIILGGAMVAVVPLIERTYSTSVRISRFAAENGWLYQHKAANPSHHGVIFGNGHSRFASDIVYSTGDEDTASFEIGNYQYTTGSGKHQQTHHWTYCCVEMDRQLPHMVLDARANNASLFGKNLMTNLPVSLRKNQVLSLEGDFDKYFTLYAPEQYKRDALYLFTPDLMALLIDNARSFDAEVVDNRFYIYMHRRGGRQTSMTQPQFMYQLLSVIHLVGMKLHRQSDYYADDFVGDRSVDRVAEGGRRLKYGASWFAIVIVAVYILFQVGVFILDIVGGR